MPKSERSFDSDKLVNEIEEQSGKIFRKAIESLGIIILSIAGGLIVYGQISPKDVAVAIIALVICIASGFAGAIVWYYKKVIRQQSNDILAIAFTHKRNIEDLTQRMDIQELKTARWVEGLENSTGFAIYKRALDGTYLSVNQVFETMFGMDHKDLNTWKTNGIPFIHVEDYEKGNNYFLDEIDPEKPKPVQAHFYMLRGDGIAFPAYVKSQLIQENGSAVIQGVIKDMTELEDMRATIQAQQEMLNTIMEKFICSYTDAQVFEDMKKVIQECRKTNNQ